MNLPEWKELAEWLYAVLELPLLSMRKFHFNLGDVLTIVVIILVARLLVRLTRIVIYRRLAPGEKQATGKVYAISQFAKYAIYMLAFLTGLRTAGLDITLLIAGSTALFVGIGLGLQQTFNDFASGVILLFEGNLQVDDVIQIEGMIGKVTKVGLRTSRVRTRDGFLITVPNSKLVVSNVINLSHQLTESRFEVRIRLAYGSDLHHARELMLSVASQHPLVLAEPAPYVWLLDFAESGLVLALYIWTQDSFAAERTMSDLRYGVEEILRKAGFHIPYYQQEIFLRTPLDLGKRE